MRPATTSGFGAASAVRTEAIAHDARAAARIFIVNASLSQRRVINRGVRIRPLEALNLCTLAVLSIAAALLAASGRLPSAGAILGRYALMAAGVGAVAWLVRRFD